jgi:predicted O-linked N-acetylglucosamine transferase (SPINDLY family)
MTQSPAPAPLLQNALRFLEAGDADGAQLLLDTHLAKHPNDAEGHNVAGLIAQARGARVAAAEMFAAAVQLNPAEPLYAVNQAMALADLGRIDDGLRGLETALQMRPGHCDALLARALLLQRAGRVEDAVAGAKMATIFHRESARAHQMLGTMLLRARRPDEAAAALAEAVRLEPTALDGWVNLGVAQRDAGKLAEAEFSYRQALKLSPGDAIAHNNLGNVLSTAGRHGEAEAEYQAAIAAKPDYAEAKANLGNTLRDLGRTDDSAAFLADAAAQHPGHAGVLNAYGNILRIASKFDEALDVLRRALAVSPDSAEVHNNLGLVLTLKNKWEEAEGHFRAAVTARPDLPVISNNHGALLLRMFRFEDAITALANAVARDPNYDEAMCNLGVAHYMLGQATQAIEVYSRVVARSPDNGFARFGLASTLLEDQRLAEAETEIRRAIAVDPDNAMAHNTLGVLLLDQHFITDARKAMRAAADKNTISAPVFYSNYAFASLYEPDITNDEVFAIQTEFAKRFATTVPEPSRPHVNARDPERKLTLAYMSSDFRTHSVSYFFEALLEKHDRSRFRIVLYSNTSRKDRVTEEMKKAADVWVETLGLTDDAFAKRIREDQVDVLVDLGGHTSGNRLPVAARGVAPVQVEYLGYPETTGVPAMQYRITDARAEPPGAEEYSTEKLIRLPDCFHCYRPHGKAPDPAPAPHVAKGYVTYASFNVLPKVNDRTIAAWCEILKAVPTARFYIKCKQLRDPSVQGRIRGDFARFGVDPARVDMEAFVPSVRDHLAQYGLVDLALDTFPYNGTTTTCEAMWMGVPVLTLAGDNHRSRVGLSLMSAMGLDKEFVAHSSKDYVERAVAWGKTPSFLAEIRQKMRSRMAASRLRDEVGFTRTIETAYRDAWRAWCAGPQTYEFKAPPELRPEDSIQGVVVRTF